MQAGAALRPDPALRAGFLHLLPLLPKPGGLDRAAGSAGEAHAVKVPALLGPLWVSLA